MAARDVGGVAAMIARWLQGQDRWAIAHHYDLSNEFYALFLDERMVYTCAYYRDPEDDLDSAQAAKLDLVCRKLDLQPGDRLLDVGCGWGGLVAWAAMHYGVEVVGVTLSEAQAAWGQAALRRAGLTRRARIVHGDYRTFEAGGSFDKIAALGIVEHVGPRGLVTYFDHLGRLLRPGGRLLNHGITQAKGTGSTSLMRFVTTHVFPRGGLSDISTTLDVGERAGFVVEDVERLGDHYARTTGQWVERLERQAEQARALVGERTYRLWRVYLAGASVAFAEGSIDLHQTVLRRREVGASEAAPRTRERWYLGVDTVPVRAHSA